MWQLEATTRYLTWHVLEQVQRPELLGPESFSAGNVPAQLGWGGSSGSCTGCSSPSSVFNGHNPDVVLLTVGADDVDFKGWITTCYAGTSACNTSSNTTALYGEVSAAEGNLRLDLTELNRWAGTKSKTLEVIVTNYYDPFPSTYDSSCIDIAAGVLSGTYPWIWRNIGRAVMDRRWTRRP